MKRVLRLIAVLGLCWASASAAPVACVPGTLTDYINLDFDVGCTVGGARFFNFFESQLSTGATPISPDLVQVTPTSGPGRAGFLFTYGIGVLAGEFAQSHFDYAMEAPKALGIVGLLEMTDSMVTGDGVNTVVENFCFGEEFLFGNCFAASDVMIVFDIGDVEELSARLDLGQTTVLGISKDVVIDAGLVGSASLGSVRNEFLLIPEPVPGLTAMSGLFACAALGALRRRRGGGGR